MRAEAAVPTVVNRTLRKRATGSTATGIRTPVSAVRGRRPSPLDDGGRRSASVAAGLYFACNVRGRLDGYDVGLETTASAGLRLLAGVRRSARFRLLGADRQVG